MVITYLVYGEYHPVQGRSWFLTYPLTYTLQTQSVILLPQQGYNHNTIFNASFIYTEEGMNIDSWKYYPKEHLAPFTEEVQTYLYNHQHPINCENKRFLISHGNGIEAGLGSHLHISGMHLALAIELDRIFIWSPDIASIYTDEVTCNGNQNIQCFFRSPTNCSIADAYREGSDTNDVRYGLAGAEYNLNYWFTPTVFRTMWEQAQIPIGEHESKYWWRGQSVAYLARFRPESIALIKTLRTEPEKILGFPNKTATEKWLTQVTSSFPLPPGTINLHIRHGDKGIEMQLVEDQKYFTAAENLVVQAPMGYRRTAFISTEDPSTIEYVKSNGNAELVNKGWRYAWYDVPRINSNGIDQLDKISTIKRGILTHIWWLQLLMALECDAWIGTRGSNWNRLIDELRCIWVPKCKHEYVEVGTNPNDYKEYNWL